MRIANTSLVNATEPGTNRAFSSFGSVTALDDGRLLVTYRIGSTKDCDDERVEMRESLDGGATWSARRTPFPSFPDHSVKLVYLTPLAGGVLIGAAMAVDRKTYPGKPLFNEATQGCIPMRILISHSQNDGQTWSAWSQVYMPENIGPPSLTSPLLILKDGRLVLSVESNKQYLDSSPWIQRVTHLYSSDNGRTWGRPTVVAHDPSGRIFNWDQRAGVAPTGEIVTFSWVYDNEAGAYRNITRRYSTDGGESWTEPEDLGFADQPSRPAIFGDGRVILSWVDRFGTQSIRARMARQFHAQFEASTEVVLYESPRAAISANAALSETLDEMSRWAYGLPFAHPLPDGDALVVYYAGTAAGTSLYCARLTDTK